MGVETADGRVYAAIGGGYATDGRSSTEVQCAFALMNAATDCAESRRDTLEGAGARFDETDRDLEFVLRCLEWGVQYTVVDRSGGHALARSGRVLLPEYERR